MRNIIDKYIYIYSTVEKLPKKIEFSSFILKKNKHQYFVVTKGIYLSDFYFHLSSTEPENYNSDALFIIFVLLSCFDIDLKFRVISKTKLIIMLNMMHSNSIDRSIYLKKILKIHGVSEDLESGSFLFVNKFLTYIKDGVNFNLNGISKDFIENNKNIKSEKKKKIKSIMNSFFDKFENKKENNFKLIDYDKVLMGLINNDFDMQYLISLGIDEVINIFEYCLKYYRFGTWDSSNFEYMSIYYNHKKIDSLVDILEDDESVIRFECEYFIESLILNVTSVEMVDYILSKIKNENNKVKFNFITFKSVLSTIEIKKYVKKDILKYTDKNLT